MRVGDRYEYDPTFDLLDKKGFGTVYRAVDTLENKVVALKCIPPDLLPSHYNLSDEILRVKYHTHDNLVKYHEVFEAELPVEVTALPEGVIPDTQDLTSSLIKTEETMKFHVVVMEYIEGNTLDKYPIYNLTEETLQSLLRDILLGLHYLHDHRIIHRDFRQGKIIIQEQAGKLVPKILYFGLSNQLSQYMSNYGYLPPERLGKYDEVITEMSDIWMLGVMIYELLTNQLPFGSTQDGLANDTIMVNILSDHIIGDTTYLIPPYKAIIEKCLANDPRLRFQQVSEILTYFPAQEQPEPDTTTDNQNFSSFETTRGFDENTQYDIPEIPNTETVDKEEKKVLDEEDEYIFGTENHEPVIIGEPQYVPSETEAK